jgi:two-component system phosphate regulon sensor histidine kinase PhoR
MRIQTRLTLLLIGVSVCVITAAGIFSTFALDDYFTSRIRGELATQVREVDFVLRNVVSPESSGYDRLRRYAEAGDLRLTLVAAGGAVLFDSDVPEDRVGAMENHASRPEIREALRAGDGTAVRHSATLDKDLLYLARRVDVPFPSGSGFAQAAVVRVAIPLTSVDAVKSDISNKIILASLVVLAFVVVLSVVLSRRLARPIQEMAATAERIRRGDLDQRIAVRSGDELGRLAASLNGMVDTLNADITKLRKLEQVRSEFLGNVSHELRTPIFAIQGMLETLLGGALEDREVNRNFVESALRNTERLNSLLADLIDISSIESGEMKLSFRYFGVRGFLESVAAEMAPVAARTAATVSLGEIPADLEVLGDKERLRQVMVNLIDNALKYSDRGRTVRVEARASDGRVVIAVTDQGVGIPAEDVLRIFERFYRVDKERSRDAGGTGLGLAIVKHIIEAHGSHVEVTSAVGSGSTFSFSLASA